MSSGPPGPPATFLQLLQKLRYDNVSVILVLKDEKMRRVVGKISDVGYDYLKFASLYEGETTNYSAFGDRPRQVAENLYNDDSFLTGNIIVPLSQVLAVYAEVRR